MTVQHLCWRLLLIALLLPIQSLNAAAEPISVFVSLLPQRIFVERIGGQWVRAQSLLEAGQNPHAFDPRPRQIALLAEADLYVRIGAPFEDAWLERIRAVNPNLRVLDARADIDLIPQTDEHAQDHDHDHGGDMDTHIWTSPPLVKIMGRHIREALIALDPAHADEFASNERRFAADLDALDSAIRARLASAKQRRFLAFHPAWGYFAATYGLEQIAVEKNGKEPGARALAALIDQAQAEGVTLILAQPQIAPRAAEQVAHAIGGRVAIIDPLAADYFATLLQLADLIAGETP